MIEKIKKFILERYNSYNKKGLYYLFRNKDYIVDDLESWGRGYQPIYNDIPELKVGYKEIEATLLNEISKYGEIKRLMLTTYRNTITLCYYYKDKPSVEYIIEIVFDNPKREFNISTSVGDYAYAYTTFSQVKKYQEDLKNKKWSRLKNRLFHFIVYENYKFTSKKMKDLIYKGIVFLNKKRINCMNAMFGMENLKECRRETQPSQFSVFHFRIYRDEMINYDRLDNLNNVFIESLINYYKMSLIAKADFKNFKNYRFFEIYKKESKHFHKLDIFNDLEFDHDKYLELMDIVRSTDYEYNEDTKELINLNFKK